MRISDWSSDVCSSDLCLTVDEPRQKEIEQSVRDMLAEVQKYVPGYKLVNGPVFDGQRVTTFMQVEGLGDFLPKYAGNLDITTASATRTADMFAEEILAGRLTLAAVAGRTEAHKYETTS